MQEKGRLKRMRRLTYIWPCKCCTPEVSFEEGLQGAAALPQLCRIGLGFKTDLAGVSVRAFVPPSGASARKTRVHAEQLH